MSKKKYIEFKLNEVKLDSRIIIIGKRGTKKTSIVQNILLYYSKYVNDDNILLLSPVEKYRQEYKNIFKNIHVFNHYDELGINQFMRKTNFHKIVIMEDGHVPRSIACNMINLSEQFNGVLIIVGQYPYNYLTKCKPDYIFLTQDMFLNNRRDYFKYFFNKYYSTFADFNVGFDAVINKYTSMIARMDAKLIARRQVKYYDSFYTSCYKIIHLINNIKTDKYNIWRKQWCILNSCNKFIIMELSIIVLGYLT